MITEIRMPRLSVNDAQAVLVEWSVAHNGFVQANQDLCVVETSKITQPITAERGGYLRHGAHPGDEIPVQGVIGWIADHPGEEPSSIEAQSEAPSIAVTQPARALAARLGIPIERLPATAGMIREKDVREYAAQRTGQEGAQPEGPMRELPPGLPSEAVKGMRPLSRAQRAITDAVLRSTETNVHAYAALDVSVDRATAAVEAVSRRAGHAVRLNDAVLFAAARALLDHPTFNGFFWKDQVVTYQAVHLGVAIDFDGTLVIPVIRDADRKTLGEIAAASSLLQIKVARRALTVEECEGGTFTVTNLGGLGIHTFVPLIYGPQAAILAVGTVTHRPHLEHGTWTQKAYLTLGLSYDHRLHNGAAAARFLSSVKRSLEELASPDDGSDG